MVSGWSTVWSARHVVPPVGDKRNTAWRLATDTVWILVCLWGSMSPKRPERRIDHAAAQYGFGECVLRGIQKGNWSECSYSNDLGSGGLSYFQAGQGSCQCDAHTVAAIFASAKSCWKPLAIPTTPLLVESNLWRLWCTEDSRGRGMARNVPRYIKYQINMQSKICRERIYLVPLV